jgi:hypothetical protein
MVVAKGAQGAEESSTYAVGLKRYEFNQGEYAVFALTVEPKGPTDVAQLSQDMLSSDTDTLYYYDKQLGAWQGHPKFLPSDINKGDVELGKAYIVYIHAEHVSYSFVGV